MHGKLQRDKLYKYYFRGIAEPVEIQASCSIEARSMLRSVMPKLDDKYKKSRKVIGETVTKLLVGVSSRVDNKTGEKMIWVGLDIAKSGWQSEKELQRAADKYAEKENVIKLNDTTRRR